MFGNHEFSMDVVSRDVPGLIGMDILDSKDRGISIFKLYISNRQLMVDGFRIQLLGPRKSHLSLPNKLITISPKDRRTKTFHSSGQISYHPVKMLGRLQSVSMAVFPLVK